LSVCCHASFSELTLFEPQVRIMRIMPEVLWLALTQWFDKAAGWLRKARARFLWLDKAITVLTALRAMVGGISAVWWVALAVCALAGLAFLLRCLHLFDADHYFILSPDSYFFHWVAQGVMAGEPPPLSPGGQAAYTLHSGLAYPLAYIAKALSAVFNLSSGDALDVAVKFLPPALSVISLIVIYLAVARIYGRRIALISALVWAVVFQAVMIGAAGFVDRDSLSLLLLMTGAFVFYLSGGWGLRVGNMRLGWLAGALLVLAIEVLLYLEWSFVGPALLMAVVVSYFLVKVVLGYLGRMETESSAGRRWLAAVREVNWRSFAVIALGNVVAVGAMAAMNPGLVGSWLRIATDPGSVGGGVRIAEMQGIGLGDLLVYQFLLIPLVAGLYAAWKRREDSTIFFACWFLGLLVASIFAKRVLLYATPAVCVLSGVGLAAIWGWARRGEAQVFGKAGVLLVLFLMLVIYCYMPATMAATPGMAADTEWQDALAYIREETPEDAVIMSQWSWGYWILDLGERRPLVDNGYYGYDSDKLNDIALAYAATDPAEAARVMQKWGTDYLILSGLDADRYALTILEWANLDEEYTLFRSDSLILRSLSGDFQSGGGLEVVYRSVPKAESVSEPEVVILGLIQPEMP